MWICLNDAFLSIVVDLENPARLLVRTRTKGHLEKLFPMFLDDIRHTPLRDYAYRLSLHPGTVATMLANQIKNITYTNFKASVKDDQLHEVYHNFWVTMLNYQIGKTHAASN